MSSQPASAPVGPYPRQTMRRHLLSLCAVALVSACGGGSGTANGSPSAAPIVTQAPAPTEAACPIAASKRFVWPQDVPQDLPQPPTSKLGETTKTKEGLTIVKFTTTTSLQQGVLFVVKEIQKAGFTLGRGDAEPAEADAPFGRGELRGIYKMLARDKCATDWLVAVTRTRPGGGSPVLPTASRGTQSSPLPFG